MVIDRAAFIAFTEDSEWLAENYEEIRDSGNKVVAIKDGEILIEGETMEEVLRELEKLGENSAYLLIEVMPPDDAAYIL